MLHNIPVFPERHQALKGNVTPVLLPKLSFEVVPPEFLQWWNNVQFIIYQEERKKVIRILVK